MGDIHAVIPVVGGLESLKSLIDQCVSAEEGRRFSSFDEFGAWCAQVMTRDADHDYVVAWLTRPDQQLFSRRLSRPGGGGLSAADHALVEDMISLAGGPKSLINLLGPADRNHRFRFTRLNELAAWFTRDAADAAAAENTQITAAVAADALEDGEGTNPSTLIECSSGSAQTQALAVKTQAPSQQQQQEQEEEQQQRQAGASAEQVVETVPPMLGQSETQRLDNCPATMGSAHTWVEGFCSECDEARNSESDLEVEQPEQPSSQQQTQTHFCPATTGGAHILALGVCILCDWDESEPEVEPVKIFDIICPATTGGLHKFVNGFCSDCDLEELEGHDATTAAAAKLRIWRVAASY
jgi:hypothetical protein